MHVILAGATGLVGGLVLERLSRRSDVDTITTVARRPTECREPKHVSVVAPVTEWPQHVATADGNVGICCLGTTIRAAGSKHAFAAIDLDAVTAFAKACHDGGVRQFIMVSSVGADPVSRNFYLSVKGKAEAAVREMGFERLDIMRPGLLVGQRSGAVRVGERIAIAISPLTDMLTPNVLSRYRSVPAGIVAKAIVGCIGAAPRGLFAHHNDEMRAIRSDLD